MPERREQFYNLFRETPDGVLEPMRRLMINGVTMGPGVKIGKGVSFGGIDLHLYKGLDAAIDEQGDTVVIKGFYPV